MNPSARFYRLLLYVFIFCSSFLIAEEDFVKIHHYYCTVSDEAYFPALMSLIGSIHENDFEDLDEIAVFDIGLSIPQRFTLQSIEKVSVYSIDLVHPDLCTYFPTNPHGKCVRGWYAWKPVIMKQALTMFPYALYLDAGTLILTSPKNLFEHIKEMGYFFIEIAPHTIESRITNSVIEKVLAKFPLEVAEQILSKNTFMIDAGMQGFSREVYASYIEPIAQLAEDLSIFADDGSAKMGFGEARHDQTLFSIFAHMNHFKFHQYGWSFLETKNGVKPVHVHWDPNEIHNRTTLYHSRLDRHFNGDKTQKIRWRK